MIEHAKMMAAYNDWANRRLFDACGRLDKDDLHAGLGAYFGSLHGTLNHMLVADTIWLARLRGEPPPDLALDATPHETFADLRKARLAEDAALIAFAETLEPAALDRPISYTTVSRPAEVTQPTWSALMHVFNHQTHHRGQCHAMLTRLAVEAPGFNLIDFQRESGLGMAP